MCIRDRSHRGPLARTPTPNAGCVPVRTEALDWILVWNQSHLHRVLTTYRAHYNTARPHRGLGRDLPVPAPAVDDDPIIAGQDLRPIERVDVLGGLIHEYRRAA